VRSPSLAALGFFAFACTAEVIEPLETASSASGTGGVTVAASSSSGLGAGGDPAAGGGTAGSSEGGGGESGIPVGALVSDFSLQDVNPASPTADQPVSPRDYLQRVSGWYFGHAT
jgi:hypothetical protein